MADTIVDYRQGTPKIGITWLTKDYNEGFLSTFEGGDCNGIFRSWNIAKWQQWRRPLPTII